MFLNHFQSLQVSNPLARTVGDDLTLESGVPVHHLCKNCDLFVCCEGLSRSQLHSSAPFRHVGRDTHPLANATNRNATAQVKSVTWASQRNPHPCLRTVPTVVCTSQSLSVPALCIWYTKCCECINSCSTSVSRLHLYWVCVLVLSPRLHCSRCKVLRRPLSMQVRGFK